MNTLLLDRTMWDLCLDAKGNIAIASEPYSNQQDVCTACKLFKGELYYDITRGIPYFEQILGHRPPLSVLKAELIQAALTVPDVASAEVFISSFTGREIGGQIRLTLTSGATARISLGPTVPI